MNVNELVEEIKKDFNNLYNVNEELTKEDVRELMKQINMEDFLFFIKNEKSFIIVYDILNFVSGSETASKILNVYLENKTNEEKAKLLVDARIVDKWNIKNIEFNNNELHSLLLEIVGEEDPNYYDIFEYIVYGRKCDVDFKNEKVQEIVKKIISTTSHVNYNSLVKLNAFEYLTEDNYIELKIHSNKIEKETKKLIELMSNMDTRIKVKVLYNTIMNDCDYGNVATKKALSLLEHIKNDITLHSSKEIVELLFKFRTIRPNVNNLLEYKSILTAELELDQFEFSNVEDVKILFDNFKVSQELKEYLWFKNSDLEYRRNLLNLENAEFYKIQDVYITVKQLFNLIGKTNLTENEIRFVKLNLRFEIVSITNVKQIEFLLEHGYKYNDFRKAIVKFSEDIVKALRNFLIN